MGLRLRHPTLGSISRCERMQDGSGQASDSAIPAMSVLGARLRSKLAY
jgi:hypothetical protein